MVSQSGDGGLAVGARDGDPRAGVIGLAPCELDLADDLVAYGSGRAVQVGELGDARACDAQLETPAARLRQAIDRALAELDDGAAVACLARIRIGSGIGLPAEHGQLGHAATELRHKVIHSIMTGLAQTEHEDAAQAFGSVFFACKHLLVLHTLCHRHQGFCEVHGEAERGQHAGDDPEAHDDLRFGPTLLLEMMMKRGHKEDALMGFLVVEHLDHDR